MCLCGHRSGWIDWLREYANELLRGSIPKVLRGALTDAELTEKFEALRSGVAEFDELTACTIHSFCQQIIMSGLS